MTTREIEALCARAQNDLKTNDLKTVLADPLWQRLLEQDRHFPQALPVGFRLLLLRHCFDSWGGFEPPQSAVSPASPPDSQDPDEWDSDRWIDVLSSVEVDLDPWEIRWPGVDYPDAEEPLEHTFELAEGWRVTFFFADCDLEMADCGEGSQEKPSLLALLTAFFRDPGQDLREAVAEEEGAGYEVAMSPEGGGYFRATHVEIFSGEGATRRIDMEDLEDAFNSDADLIRQIDPALMSLPGDALAGLAKESWFPLFSEGPEISAENQAIETWDSELGVIHVSWTADCWIPQADALSDRAGGPERVAMTRTPVRLRFTAKGHACDDYTTLFACGPVGDAEEAILRSLDSQPAVDLNDLYLTALGLL